MKQQLCGVEVPPRAITELDNLVKAARLGPVTFETSQPKPSTKYGLTRSWLEQAFRAWTDESVFNW